MEQITLYQPANTVIGANSIQQLPHFIHTLQKKKPLIVTDPGLIKIGTVGKITAVLSDSQIDFDVFDQVVANPTIENVNQAFSLLEAGQHDLIIAIGGGSPIDVAKAVGILATNGGSIVDYAGVNRSQHPAMPIIAINTTAGTGSEVTRAYVITDHENKTKLLMVDHHCLASVAINDPLLMTDMPPSLTAMTGMDALTHAIEAYTAKNHNPFTDGLARQAISIICESLPIVFQSPYDIHHRTQMCWAAYLAGLAFSNAGLGLVHAMAHQLGGFYNLPHGMVNAILLPHVMQYNAQSVKERYTDIASSMGVDMFHRSKDAIVDATIDYVLQLSETLCIPCLSSTIFNPSDISHLSLQAMQDASYKDNACAASLTDIQDIFHNAYSF